MYYIHHDTCISDTYLGRVISHSKVTQAGFEPPLVDDTSYEADALTTKPPRLNHKLTLKQAQSKFAHA